jgi:hypothetical protein
MKQKLKTISKLLTFFLLIASSSCQKDLDEDINPNPNQRIQHKTLNEVLKNVDFTSSLSKISNNYKTNSKTITTPTQNITAIEDQFGFTISPQEVNIATNDSITSYTMLITRDSIQPNVFENLIVQTNNQDEMSAYILKYINNIEITPDFSITDFQGITSLETIISGSSTAKECITITSWYCYGNLHHTTAEGCTMGYEISTRHCSGGGGGAGGGSGGAGSSSNSSSSSSSVIITVPIAPKPPLLEDDPCASLSKLADPNKGKVDTAIAYLRAQLGNNTEGEDGVSFELSTNGLNYTNTDLPSTTNNSIPIPTGARIYGAAHTHNGGLEQIFSFSDVIILYKLYSICDSALQPDVFFMLVSENGSIYAIKMDNFATLQTFLLSYMNDSKYANYNLKDKIEKINKDFHDKIYQKGNLPNDLLRGFLEVTKTAGIQVIEKREAGWQKLSLPAIKSDPIVKTPCN